MLMQAGAAGQALTLPAGVAAAVSVPLPLQFVASALWAVLFGLWTVALWRKPGTRTRQGVLWLLVAFAVYSVARLTLFSRADYDLGRLPFVFLLAVLFIIILAAYAIRAAQMNPQITEKQNHDVEP